MANTPNIDLVKPAGTDHALVSVINSNSDKIDTCAGSTNAAISTLLPKTQVGSSAYDLNDLETGFVYWTGTNRPNVSNKPANLAGSVFAVGTGNRVQQYAFVGNSSTTDVYYRYNAAGTWASWKKLETTDSSSSTIATGDWSTHNTTSVNRVTLQNNMVHLELMMEYESGYNLPTGTTFATVPSGYRPSATTDVCAMIKHNSSDKWLASKVSISSSGTIQQNLTASCGGFMIDCWYPVA